MRKNAGEIDEEKALEWIDKLEECGTLKKGLLVNFWR